MKDDRLSLSGFALFSRTKVGLGLIRRDKDGSPTRRSDLWYAGVAYDIIPALTLAGQMNYLKYHNSDNKAFLPAVRAMYSFSKRTSAYATVGYITNGGQLGLSVSSGTAGTTPQAGGAQVGAMLGMKHVF